MAPRSIQRAASVRFGASLGVAACYLAGALLAFLRYPQPYSPAQNWLSDLGNPSISPNGAPFYNVGVALAAIGLLAFFVRFVWLRLSGSKPQRAMVALTLAFGCVGAVSMLLSALFPIHQPQAHSLASMGLYVGFGTAFAFSVAALRYYRRYPRWLLGCGALVTLADLVTQLAFTHVTATEWVTAALLLGYCLALGAATRRLEPAA